MLLIQMVISQSSSFFTCQQPSTHLITFFSLKRCFQLADEPLISPGFSPGFPPTSLAVPSQFTVAESSPFSSFSSATPSEFWGPRVQFSPLHYFISIFISPMISPFLVVSNNIYMHTIHFFFLFSLNSRLPRPADRSTQPPGCPTEF